MRFTATILVISALILGSCGDGAPEWESAYLDRLQSAQDQLTPAEIVQACASVDPMTDDELRQLFASNAGGDSTFDELMTELDIEPAVEDYDQAIEIAVENARELCA